MVSTVVIVYKLFVMTKFKKPRSLSTQNRSTSERDLVAFKNKTSSKNQIIIIKSKTILTGERASVIKNLRCQTRRKRNQTYWILIALNFSFFILVTPLVSFNSIGFWGSDKIREICYVLSYMNNCIHFFFYIITCESYREVFIEMMKKI